MALCLVYDWSLTLGLVFGGCCSNAISLEQLTSQYPNAGSLITLFQFVLISLRGLPRHVIWTRSGPRFRPRRIPLTPYLVQVALFYLVSLLNNAAFGYEIPMAVHIIFRSGGLIVSMFLGWLISGKRYNVTQILSVLLVTLGVVLTTFSATPSSTVSIAGQDTWNYAIGIAILSLALVFAGFLGLAQDWTYSTYGRPQPSNDKATTGTDTRPPQWQESLFYLHFLSLPMFLLVREDIKTQFHAVSISQRTFWFTTFPIPSAFWPFIPKTRNLPSFISVAQTLQPSSNLAFSFRIPSAYVLLLLNTVTQLICVSGVHRLTTRMSSLTVTLVLVVRKAVSLLISVLGANIIPGVGGGKARTVDQRMMWSGAFFVLLGTILYSIGTVRRSVDKGEKGKKQ